MRLYEPGVVFLTAAGPPRTDWVISLAENILSLFSILG